MEQGVDSIWVGNLGYYNEGRLVGDWIALPVDPAELAGTIGERCHVDPFHEEVAIFDTNLEGPMGLLGLEGSDLGWAGIDDLSVMQHADHHDLEITTRYANHADPNLIRTIRERGPEF